ncbi:hypothetical protein JCM10212_006235 [Sporobolomyces blumeae]
MRFRHVVALLLASPAALLLARAQDVTLTDADGNVILATVVTDANGDPSETLLVETLTPADEVTTTTTAATTTTTAAATTTTTDEAVGQPAVVATPQSRCTTAGCPVDPTTYVQNGVTMTWTATTPTTPIPTWTSSGNIVAASAYITTVSTAKGLAAGGSPNFRIPLVSSVALGDWGVVGGVAFVAGLVGAVAVL